MRRPDIKDLTNVINRRNALAMGGAVALSAAFPAVAATQDRLNVVATTGMIADAALQIGGDLVAVKGLMGPGVDPHAYRQTRTDIAALTRADLVLWHGLYLEAQMENFMHRLAAKRNVVAVAETLEPSLLLAHDIYTDKVDPHVWMAPRLWLNVIDAVEAALSDTRPDLAEHFAAGANAHRDRITGLADYAALVLASVPEGNRVLVTAHDAFKYFGAAHGFEVLGIQGISTESEAGLNKISQLVDMLVERQIGAVFVESSVSDRNIRALIEGAGAKGHEVQIGGELFSDAMGEPGTYEGSYVGMIDHNVTVIARALGGQVPHRGMNGTLMVGS